MLKQLMHVKVFATEKYIRIFAAYKLLLTSLTAVIGFHIYAYLNILYHILELSVCEYRQFLIRTFSLTIYIGFCHNYIFPPPLVKVEGFFIALSEHA